MSTYLLDRRKTGPARTSGNRKLDKFDVREIRRWVRTEGYGLMGSEQADALTQTFPGVAPKTLLDVIQNRSWYDPTYDPALPLFLPVNAPPEWIGWFLSLILFWRSLCSVQSGAGSQVTAPTVISN